MSQELIDAANNLKAAAEALIEISNRPRLSIADMSDEDKEALRALINPWLEKDVGERMTIIEGRFDELDVDSTIEKSVRRHMASYDFDAVLAEELENKIGDLGKLDVEELRRTVSEVEDMPDGTDVSEVVEAVDVDEYRRMQRTMERVDTILNLLEPLVREAVVRRQEAGDQGAVRTQ